MRNFHVNPPRKPFPPLKILQSYKPTLISPPKVNYFEMIFLDSELCLTRTLTPDTSQAPNTPSHSLIANFFSWTSIMKILILKFLIDFSWLVWKSKYKKWSLGIVSKMSQRWLKDVSKFHHFLIISYYNNLCKFETLDFNFGLLIDSTLINLIKNDVFWIFTQNLGWLIK